jgi:hypothetical protein
MPGHLSPGQRVQLAKELRRRANGQPKLKARFRRTLRRHAANLMQVNLIEARDRSQQPGAGVVPE